MFEEVLGALMAPIFFALRGWGRVEEPISLLGGPNGPDMWPGRLGHVARDSPDMWPGRPCGPVVRAKSADACWAAATDGGLSEGESCNMQNACSSAHVPAALATCHTKKPDGQRACRQWQSEGQGLQSVLAAARFAVAPPAKVVRKA